MKVWDPLLRLFHWSLVATIALAWLTAEDSETWHEWVGYGALGLIGFRLVWGLIGPRFARFTQFIAGRHTVTQYVTDMLLLREKRYLGHNPLGAVMVVLLLATTAATGVTGWLTTEPDRLALMPEMSAFITPAFADSDWGEGRGYGEEEILEEVHEAIATLLLLLIFLHVAGVIYASKRHKENLVAAMITGKKKPPEPGDVN